MVQHQVGFDPEIHKVNRAVALLLWFLVLPSAVCFVLKLASFLVAEGCQRFISHRKQRKNISSYNHGKYLSIILNLNGSCAFLLRDHLYQLQGSTSPP